MNFGLAVHHTIEYVYDKEKRESLALGVSEFFVKELKEQILSLPMSAFLKKNEKSISDEEVIKRKIKNITEMTDQGFRIIKEYFVEMKNTFGNYEIVSVEEKLEWPLELSEKYKKKYKFKGYIDMVIKLEDGTYCILDTKTTSWGWDAKKKTDKMITYQLTYYKNFFSQKHGIPLENIKTYFVLLKRTVKKEPIEIFEVPVGHKKIANSLELMNKTLLNIDRGIAVKNRESCVDKDGYKCPFYKTDLCR